MILALLALLVPAVRVAAAPARVPAECGWEVEGPTAVYLGGWVPAALDDPRMPRDQDPLGRFEALAGKPITVVNRWVHWGMPRNDRVDIKWLRRAVERGAFPMITWVPWDPTIPKPEFQTGFLLREIADGAHEWYIADIASEVAEWDGPVFIRFAQEMNGTWYPWGKHQNSPEEFVAAWRRVHEIFARGGAGHVTWVWNPSEKNHPESLGLWYPGDDVVDWVAVDGYNWDDPVYWKDARGETWRTLDQVFARSFDDIARFVPEAMPWMIAETSSAEREGDPDRKAAWICDAFRRALPEVFPRVKAILWFDQPTDEGGKEFTWQVESGEPSRAAFPVAVAPEYYAGDLGDLPRRLGRARIPIPERLADVVAGR